MTIDRSDVAETEVFKQHATVQSSFNALLDLREKPLGRIAQYRHSVQDFHQFGFQPGVKRVRAQAVQIIRHPAYARANGHHVVIEHHQKFLKPPGVVHRFIDNTGRKSPVADDRDRVPVSLSKDLISTAQPRHRRNTATSVTSHEQVVVTFPRIRVTHQSTLGADRGKLVITPRNLACVDRSDGPCPR